MSACQKRQYPALRGWVWEEQVYMAGTVQESLDVLLLSGEEPSAAWEPSRVLGVINRFRERLNPNGVVSEPHFVWQWETRTDDPPRHGRTSERFEAESQLLMALRTEPLVEPEAAMPAPLRWDTSRLSEAAQRGIRQAWAEAGIRQSRLPGF
jgi:hypothetical protein